MGDDEISVATVTGASACPVAVGIPVVRNAVIIVVGIRRAQLAVAIEVPPGWIAAEVVALAFRQLNRRQQLLHDDFFSIFDQNENDIGLAG